MFPVYEQSPSPCSSLYALYSAEHIGALLCVAGPDHPSVMVKLSAQQILDCSRSAGNLGCNGGTPYNSFRYVLKQGGIDGELSYPFENREGKCRFSAPLVAAQITGYNIVLPFNETDLTQRLAAVGPMPSIIDASQPSFQFYQSGLYYEPRCSSNLGDHLVMLVGYGSFGGPNTDYYIARNR